MVVGRGHPSGIRIGFREFNALALENRILLRHPLIKGAPRCRGIFVPSIIGTDSRLHHRGRRCRRSRRVGARFDHLTRRDEYIKLLRFRAGFLFFYSFSSFTFFPYLPIYLPTSLPPYLPLFVCFRFVESLFAFYRCYDPLAGCPRRDLYFCRVTNARADAPHFES